MFITKAELISDVLYIQIDGCSNNCKSCTKKPPRDIVSINNIEYIIDELISTKDIAQVIISGDDPLYCGNKKDLIKLVSKFTAYKISIMSKYKKSWFNNEKHIEIVSK